MKEHKTEILDNLGVAKFNLTEIYHRLIQKRYDINSKEAMEIKKRIRGLECEVEHVKKIIKRIC